ncbi:MAG: BlaR1 family beta-lactam sensor/signal transducer [Lachnospiraceae bacterium]|nr:BlaR1 family beta-lactam sensor/signal transducer [Lachnospiraceae bacterium]
MTEFMIRFLICNIFISIIIGILLLTKHLLKNSLTNRMHYNLWFLLLGLLFVPFIPVQPIRFLQIITWFGNMKNVASSPIGTVINETAAQSQSNTANWMNDFSISFSRKTPGAVGLMLFILWCIGIFIMIVLIIKSMLRFNSIKSSALPLQNPAARKLYRECLDEMHITKPIPVYSTAFLKSPIIVGLFRPCIYLPIHLISDYNANGIKYMLMHELAHYKCKDALANYFMNIIGVLYWFNPLVWYSLKEMKNDREVACDTSVLKLLDEDAYEDYGNTLINFAQKVSLTPPFPFAFESNTIGISGSMKQMQKRIMNIANYHPASFKKKLHSAFAYILIAFFLLGTAPLLSIQAAENNSYYFNEANRNITYIDLSDIFEEYNGSFVLYDTAEDSWQIYNKEYATARISPASTFKIYSALFSLETGIITPEQSLIPWDGQNYLHDLWNSDQTLESAMQNSVTWYFQTLDRQTSLSSIKKYVQEIGYGNQVVEGDVSSYWINSSLKISPIEQVEMLKKLYYNQFGFSPESIKAVKDSICLYSTAEGTLSGKTGTEEVNGHNTSGWFIGYVEKDNHTYFFATNIQSEKLASGLLATELTFSILSDLQLWNTYQE